MAAKDLNLFSNNTVVGPSILISGRLSGDEDLTVRGRVEGEISLSHTLIVEESGIVKANVSVKHAIVSGVVVGNIKATESVELTPCGRMVGDIVSPRVIIVDGASFRGHVDMGDAEALRATQERPAARPLAAGHAQASRFSTAFRSSSSSRFPPRLSSSSVPQRPATRPAPMQQAVVLSAPPSSAAPPPAHSPSDADDEPAADKPLPPAPPVLIDAHKKKIVVKKKK